MKYLDRTLPTPEENLACDEALLEACEAAGGGGVLRFFESPVHFVVLGYGNRTAAEVKLEACAATGAPVLRRISGGGTVVLGPGCLGYALVLPMSLHPELQTVTGANRHIMERSRTALERLAGREIRVDGHTDLTMDGMKFGGSAQRRRAGWLLFHGTLLLRFDLGRIERLLRMPALQPEYRRQRGHLAFLTNLGVDASEAKAALRRAWGAAEPWSQPLEERIKRLLSERYARPDWHSRR
jgi:lipoate-protein ligase A